MYIYVLQLSHSKYYIGKSTNPLNRITTHIEDTRNLFIKRHKPINIISCFQSTSDFDEDNTVKEYMQKYGIENVRGGSYSNYKLSSAQIEFLSQEIQSSTNAYFKCGQNGHFANKCRLKVIKRKQVKSNTCFRCGRSTHFANICFASRHLNGSIIYINSRFNNSLISADAHSHLQQG
eukprot:NODE_1312_length_1372_cov_0.178319.p1 type:complete len:177 gc:universal NODE_1312_length_1372_cov_0.178319:490-1020(+)